MTRRLPLRGASDASEAGPAGIQKLVVEAPRTRRVAATASAVAALVAVSGALAGCEAGDAVPRNLTFDDPRIARDCVAFLRSAYRQADVDPQRARAPGARPRLQPRVYWVGRRFGSRRATVVREAMDPHVGETDADDEQYPTYSVSYQLRADGCQTSFLPGYDPAPTNWHPGRERTIMTMPLHSAAAKLALEGPAGGLQGREYRTADGTKARIAIDYGSAVGVVVADRLVIVAKAGDVTVGAAIRKLREIER